ncbi:MAG: hypothetical protein QOI27_185, partial [Gaiellaceae bacterium]|nr:hypothetical protein [Gaiellaceae bacterium]
MLGPAQPREGEHEPAPRALAVPEGRGHGGGGEVGRA